ncbi:FAD-binding domain-containing protein [Tothia fuscella]|uniref:FAD-binding domain-containing protein n=1 Tax=Tothia fuscella TaxID=1048955 RepID=A0A9P4U1I9_9PEZI|nr:FAD-binding domain-containing protein [Tothia fuscella]
MVHEEIEELKALVNPSEILTPESKEFKEHTLPFAKQKHRNPGLVVRPSTIDSLSKVIAFLAKSSLDFKIRSRGFGSASARDIIVSMTAFDNFDFDRENETLTLGCGQSWRDYYEKMEQIAPEYTGLLCGGFSWLSGEYGAASDPANLLDIQVVKLDGTIIWASEEPDLLWAMRETEGAFAVAVNFKMRCFKYPEKVWSGPILLPNTTEACKQICTGIVGMDTRSIHPRVALFLYRMAPDILKAIGDGGVGALKYTQTMYWNPIALPKLTETILMNSFEWYGKTQTAAEGALRNSSNLLFELFCCTDAANRLASGWPRPVGFRHMVFLRAGAPTEGPLDDLAKNFVTEGPKEIFGPDARLEVTANGLEPFYDPKEVFGENYEKLLQLKREYDPKNRLRTPLRA